MSATTARVCSCGKPFPHICWYENDEGDRLGPLIAEEVQGRVSYDLVLWLAPASGRETT